MNDNSGKENVWAVLDLFWILHILVTIIWFSDHQGWSHSRKSLATFPNPRFSIVFTFSLSRLGVNSFLWLALSTPRGMVTMTRLAMRVSCSVVTSTLYSTGLSQIVKFDRILNTKYIWFCKLHQILNIPNIFSKWKVPYTKTKYCYS